MTAEAALPFSVTMTLTRNGHVLSESVAETEDDLYRFIEMDTGTGYLDAAELYQRMANKKRDHLSEIFSVCNSYEKWGAMQQEVFKIRVKLQRLPDQPICSRPEVLPASSSQCVATESVDQREEWYSEYLRYTAYINQPPGWYWLGMIASVLWLVIYLIVYPSIPLLGTHWKGLGVPGGCQPWTAICEMQQEEKVLQEVRGFYLERIRKTSVTELLEDRDKSDFMTRAGKVPFAENCAGCHGQNGVGVEDFTSRLNDDIWLHGGEVQAIQASIRNPTVHPFGMLSRLDEVFAKIQAIYVYKLGGGVPAVQNGLHHE